MQAIEQKIQSVMQWSTAIAADDSVLTKASRVKASFVLGMPMSLTAQEKFKTIKAKCKGKFVIW